MPIRHLADLNPYDSNRSAIPIRYHAATTVPTDDASGGRDKPDATGEKVPESDDRHGEAPDSQEELPFPAPGEGEPGDVTVRRATRATGV